MSPILCLTYLAVLLSLALGTKSAILLSNFLVIRDLELLVHLSNFDQNSWRSFHRSEVLTGMLAFGNSLVELITPCPFGLNLVNFFVDGLSSHSGRKFSKFSSPTSSPSVWRSLTVFLLQLVDLADRFCLESLIAHHVSQAHSSPALWVVDLMRDNFVGTKIEILVESYGNQLL